MPPSDQPDRAKRPHVSAQPQPCCSAAQERIANHLGSFLIPFDGRCPAHRLGEPCMRMSEVGDSGAAPEDRGAASYGCSGFFAAAGGLTTPYYDPYLPLKTYFVRGCFLSSVIKSGQARPPGCCLPGATCRTTRAGQKKPEKEEERGKVTADAAPISPPRRIYSPCGRSPTCLPGKHIYFAPLGYFDYFELEN